VLGEETAPSFLVRHHSNHFRSSFHLFYQGANFATTKFALDTLQASVDGGGALFVAARFLVGAAALVPFLFSASSGPAVWAGVRVGALCALGYGSQSAALAMGASAGTAAFICSLQSVVVAVIASRTAGVHSVIVLYRDYVLNSVSVALISVQCRVGLSILLVQASHRIHGQPLHSPLLEWAAWSRRASLRRRLARDRSWDLLT